MTQRERLKRREARFRRARLAIRVHAWATGVCIFSYAFLGFLWGPSFSFSDFRETWNATADNVVVSAVVPPPPSVPTVTTEAVCLANTLFVNLDWADDSGATSFDIYRDGSLLVSGLVSSEYQDTSVLASTNYSYVVVAYGSMGTGVASSDPVSVSTPSSCLAFLSPTLSIETVGDTNVAGLSSVSLSDTMPTITGTSNMPNASVSISIVGAASMYAFLSTNINGYWEWTPIAAISPGSYALTVTVTHPLLPLQTASDTLSLTVLSPSAEDEGGGGHHRHKKKHAAVLTPAPTYHVPPETPLPELPTPSVPSVPLAPTEGVPSMPPAVLVLQVTNSGGWVFQSRSLETTVRVSNLRKEYVGENAEITYSILNEHDEILSVATRTVVVRDGEAFHQSIFIPRGLASGPYRVSARLRVGHSDVIAEAPFIVVELPIFALGGGMVITWNAAARFFGWASLVSIISLLFLILLFVREYWLILRLKRYVNEQDFSGRGFVRSDRRKGVGRI